MSVVYKHSYVPLSMYGNVVALLREHVATKGVHIDIGCGYGAIAEPVRDEVGLTYIGFDLAEDGLSSLKERGFDTHVIDLSDLESTEGIIKRAVGDRPIASISFLDTMEHVTNGPDVLAMLRRLADGSKAPLVISVPNITHKDIALKLLTGRLDITEAGILDHTHFNLFSDAHLKRVTASRGWIQVGANDWLLERSDQFFPSDFAILDHRTPIGGASRSLGVQANKHALVNQFVRAYAPGEALPLELYSNRSEPERPFLSVVIDAYETDADEVERILRDLEGQTNQDFNIALIVEPSLATPTDRPREPAQKAFGGRISVHERNQTVRADRLNGVAAAISGQFVAVLIPGDTLSANWADSFAALAKEGVNAVLRVGRIVTSEYTSHMPPEAILPVPLQGLVSVAEWAIPGSAIRDLGIGFDPKIGTADLRDFVVQAALLHGVCASSTPVVSQLHGGQKAGSENVDDESYLAFLTKLNANPLLLPPGSAERIERFSKAMRIVDMVTASPLLSQFIASFPQHGATAGSSAEDEEPRPFLSVIMRTQGADARIGTLREAILTLAGQSSQNFEVLLVVHTDDEGRYSAVEDLVAEFPSELTQRVRLLKCDRPGRSSPLNLAIDHIRGQYVAVFDDDDLLFAHWIETFEELAKQAPGAMLRTVSARQDFKMVGDEGSECPRAESWFKLAWHTHYDAIEHLRTNHSPFMSMAFPAGVFRDVGLRFDESLSTAEDWQLSTRVAMLCGVRSGPDITAIYRWWTNGHSSSLLIPRDEWSRNRQKVLAGLNGHPVLLPPGSTTKLVDLIDEVIELRKKLSAYENRPTEVAARKPLRPKPRKGRVDTKKIYRAQRRLKELLESRSWQSTKTLRATINLLRGQVGSGLTPDDVPNSLDANQRLIQQVQRSLSWRITVPLRAGGRLLKWVSGKKEI